jgi:hypothetical protein
MYLTITATITCNGDIEWVKEHWTFLWQLCCVVPNLCLSLLKVGHSEALGYTLNHWLQIVILQPLQLMFYTDWQPGRSWTNVTQVCMEHYERHRWINWGTKNKVAIWQVKWDNNVCLQSIILQNTAGGPSMYAIFLKPLMFCWWTMYARFLKPLQFVACGGARWWPAVWWYAMCCLLVSPTPISRLVFCVLINLVMYLTPKISSDQIWIAGYFGQPLTYPHFTIFSSDFYCNSLKS